MFFILSKANKKSIFSQSRTKAEGTGLEPVRAFARRFSKPVHYHSANPPLLYGTSRRLQPLSHISFFILSSRRQTQPRLIQLLPW